MTVRTIDEIFRDFVTDGVPASGPFNPHKPDIRDTLKAFTEGGDNFPDNRVIRLNNADEGTANNIVVTASVAIPAAAYQVLYILNVTQENTGPVTVSGAINRYLVTNINQPVPAGYLVPGMALLCIDTGTELRLLSYGDAEAILAAAEDAAARAEAAAASVNLPPATTGDKGKVLSVNSSATGYEFRSTAFVVENRTLLKALPTFLTTVFLSEVGREGTFVLKAGSPPVADTQEGVYVISNTAGYYWERVYAPMRIPSVKAFGAKLDGITDDSPAIQGALDVLGSAVVPWTATGFVAGGITLGTAQMLIAERKTIWKTPASASFAVRVTAYMSEAPSSLNQYAYIRNFTFNLSASPVTTTAIRMGTATRVVYGLRVFNCDGVGCGEFYGEEIHASNFVVDVQLTDITCVKTRGRQILSRRSRGFFTFRDVRIDHTQNTSQVTWEGARFEDLVGLELEKFDVVGPIDALVPTWTYQPTAIGIVIAGMGQGGASVWLTRVLIDNTRGPGMVVSNIFNLLSETLCIYQNLGAALELQNVSKSQFGETVIMGGKGLMGAPADAPGISMTGCSRVFFNGLRSDKNTGSGVVVNNSQRCKFTNFGAEGNTGRAYVEVGTSDRNIVSNAEYESNTAGNIAQIGTNSAHVNWITAGAGFVASNVGPITT